MKYKYPENFVLEKETKTVSGSGVLKDACICCGGDIRITWNGEMSREFAFVTDVCPLCYNADCSGISPYIDDSERWCKILQKPSRRNPADRRYIWLNPQLTKEVGKEFPWKQEWLTLCRSHCTRFCRISARNADTILLFYSVCHRTNFGGLVLGKLTFAQIAVLQKGTPLQPVVN